MESKSILKWETHSILNNYAFRINNSTKIFCPRCFCFKRDADMRRHFEFCSYWIRAKDFYEDDKIKISRAYNDRDINIRGFLRKFENFITIDNSEIRRINYNDEHDYWVIQTKNDSLGCIPIGLAAVKYSEKYKCHVLFLEIIFPRMNRNRSLGTIFIEEIAKHYIDLMIESPNDITKKICDKLEIKYYYAA